MNWLHIGIAVDSIVSIVVIVLFLRGMVDWLHVFLTVIALMRANICNRIMVVFLMTFRFKD